MATVGATRRGVDTAGGVLVGGSPNVFVNSAASVRIGDAIAGHGKSPHSGPVMVSGSSSVFINNIPSCRLGDKASCGHKSTGSSNVFIGTTPPRGLVTTQNIRPLTTQDNKRILE